MKEKTYARVRECLHDSDLHMKTKTRFIYVYQYANHPTYFRVTQPDRLDNELFNVIIQEPRCYKGYRLASVDLEFLIEKELKAELK